MKQLWEAAFRIKDIIDDYLIQVRQQPRDPGCIALLHKLKTMIPRRRIASEIQDVKCEKALKGEGALPVTMSKTDKTEMVDKARSVIVLCLGDKVLREVAKEPPRYRCGQSWSLCI